MPKPSCRDRLEQALARIADPKGEGSRACLTVYADGARAAADAADARSARGVSLGPLDGTIVSIKDLFDVAGEPTRAGSKILAEEAVPAKADATIVQRLRAAGAVIIAKTNMTEFAFSGIGANPHFGTPGNPRPRPRARRLFGGSAGRGGRRHVRDRHRHRYRRLGTHTGGAVRAGRFQAEPAARSDRGRLSAEHPLDSVGPIGRTVADCAVADAVMAGEDIVPLEPLAVAGLRFGVAEGLPLDRLDDAVASAFVAAIARLDRAGVRISHETLPQFDDMAGVNAKGGIPPFEACAIHRDRIERRASDFDPNVRFRIERGCMVSQSDYDAMVRERGLLVRAMDARLSSLDALVMPTTAIVAPTIAEVADTKVFAARNAAVLRNPSIVNFFDLCAITLPLATPIPVGLMLVARNGHDHRLLRIAAATAQLLAS